MPAACFCFFFCVSMFNCSQTFVAILLVLLIFCTYDCDRFSSDCFFVGRKISTYRLEKRCKEMQPKDIESLSSSLRVFGLKYAVNRINWLDII